MYIKTERFKLDLDKVADILRKRGYDEQWRVITPYQQEIKMYNLLENISAYIQKMKTHTTVTYSKQG